MTRRARDDAGVRISLRSLRVILGLAAAIVVVAAVIGLGALVRANEPVAVASAAQMKVQQTAAERDVERAYEQATEQVRKVRALNLAITAAQADQIAGKAITDLRTLRHSAFVSLGQVTGLSAADAEAYAAVTEGRFDQAPVAKQTASPAPVLLAPRFYTIVSRMSDLATQLADQATNQLTAPPPTPSPTPARPSASPSPSRP